MPTKVTHIDQPPKISKLATLEHMCVTADQEKNHPDINLLWCE